MVNVELVVLDIAGTTVSDPGFVAGAVQEALAAVGVTISAECVTPVMGMPKPIAIQMLLDEENRPDLDAKPIYEDFVVRMKQVYREHSDVKPIEGVEEALLKLREAGIKICLDTGFSQDITEIIVERLGWMDRVIDGAISSDQVENGRPAPDMIEHHMKEHGITDPSRVAKVGDAIADMQEGTNAGCGFVIGVLSGVSSRAELEAQPHTHLIGSVAELPGLLLPVEALS